MMGILSLASTLGRASFDIGFGFADWSGSAALGWVPALALTAIALAVLVAATTDAGPG